MRILIVMAMHAEAEPVVERLGLVPVKTPPWASPVPMRLFQGNAHGVEVDLVVNGTDERTELDLIGTQAATASTMLGCEAFKPDLVISAGTCGGFRSRGGEIAKVYLAADRVWYHDRRVPIPGFDEMARGGYPVKDLGDLGESLGLAPGIVSTGDSLDMAPVDAERIEAVGAHAKEMEAAAVAWVAGLFGAEFTAIKSVTDLVDGGRPAEEEFFENLARATEALADALVNFVRALAIRSG